MAELLGTPTPGAGVSSGVEDAVRLIDEHDGQVVVQQLLSGSSPAEPSVAMTGGGSSGPVPRQARPAPVPRGLGDAAGARGMGGAGGTRGAPAPRGRLTRALAIALVALGGLALTDAAVTLVWQEPFSALYAKFRQDDLNGSLHAIERSAPTPLEQRALASLPDERRRVAFLARELQRDAGNGSPVGRIVIPKINADYVVVKGTGTSELESGPGVYPETNFPGIPGTTAIAGHRTTYLAPFRDINLLRPGNHILLEMPYAHFTYTVIGQRVVLPTDVSAAVSSVGYSRLVLSACTPLFSAAKRLLVYARLTRTLPVGAARVLPGHPLIQPIEAGPSSAARAHARGLPPVLEPPQQNTLAPLV